MNQQGANTITQHTYTLDAVGNRTRADEVLAQVGGGTLSQTLSYGYDRLYQLTSANDGTVTTTYSYDPAGNRQVMTRGGQTNYTYDRADRIQQAGAVTYTVNANGNMVARGGDTFAYDQANRLKNTIVGGATNTYVYDGDGKRASKTAGGTTTSYVYNDNRSLPVVLSDGANKYVWGFGLSYAVDGSGNILVYHTDGGGSVRAITDASGSVVQTYRTDEFGAPASVQGSIVQPIRYAGEMWDDETGLVFLRTRYYDPQSGRFLSRDSIAGLSPAARTLHGYTYGGNNPINETDPNGKIAWVPALIGIGAAVGAVGNTVNYMVNNPKNITLGGAAEAAFKGAVAGAVATGIGMLAAAGVAAAGGGAVVSAAASGAASGLVGNTVSNVLNHRPWTENWELATAGGALLGPLAQDLSPQVGFRVGYSLTRGWGSPLGGYVGANTRALYGQELFFDAAMQYFGLALSPWHPSGSVGPIALRAGMKG